MAVLGAPSWCHQGRRGGQRAGAGGGGGLGCSQRCRMFPRYCAGPVGEKQLATLRRFSPHPLQASGMAFRDTLCLCALPHSPAILCG